MSKTSEPPAPTGPQGMLDTLAGIVSKMPEGIEKLDFGKLMQRLETTETRSKLINIKLTLLLEKLEVDWRSDPRIQKFKE
jgi:hypothetical protein